MDTTGYNDSKLYLWQSWKVMQQDVYTAHQAAHVLKSN